MDAMAGIFTVRLTVDGLRHSIIAALPAHEKTMRESMERAVDEAVKAFDFKTEVKKAAAKELQEMVRYSVAAALAEAMRSEKVQAALEGAMLLSLREQFSRRV